MWNVNKTIQLALCMEISKNLPPSNKQQRHRKSVQLFIFFHPVPPQETVSAANGAQQRLDSLVSRTDSHVVWPLTHLSKSIANTVVFSVTLKWSCALSAAPCILKGQISQHKARRWVQWDFHWCYSVCMNCWTTQKKSSGLCRGLFMKMVRYLRAFCACVGFQTHTWQSGLVFFIF